MYVTDAGTELSLPWYVYQFGAGRDGRLRDRLNGGRDNCAGNEGDASRSCP